jgi:hypothetical protein
LRFYRHLERDELRRRIARLAEDADRSDSSPDMTAPPIWRANWHRKS